MSERQMATNLTEVREDHRLRYEFAIAELQRLSPNHSGATMNAAYADGHVATQTMVTPSEVLIDDGQ